MVITVKRNFDKENDILNKVSMYIHGDSNRENIKHVHVSDLLWCMRQSFYKKNAPVELSMDEVLKFFKGKVSEYAVGKFIFTEEHYKQQEKIRGENGIMAHPDIISHKEDLVIELKQTDKFSFVDPRDTVFNSFIYYITQLLYYMYLAKKKKGSIIVNHSNYNMFYSKMDLDKKDSNPFRIFSVELDDSDFKTIEQDLNFKKQLLEEALKKNDVAYLPKLVNLNPNDTSKCNKCKFLETCKVDADYWEYGNRHEKVDFIIKFGSNQIEETDVNYLYKNMEIHFEGLGRHYKK